MLIWKKTRNKSQKLELWSAVTQFYKFFLLLTYNFECKHLQFKAPVCEGQPIRRQVV